MKRCVLLFLVAMIFGVSARNVWAQTSPSVLYVPLIGLTSVPKPLALPNGPGTVVYSYAVKNFLKEIALKDIQVVDTGCSPVKFVTGDDNGDAQLDYAETWRYTCSTRLSQTTQSTATATGVANSITATHQAFATVVVGSDTSPPLISISNVTKIAYPLSVPAEGSMITFTYKVNNPGLVALSDVAVTDDQCSGMSGKLGDTNGNNLLDTNEVWIYTCTTHLKHTTIDTVNVTAFANGLRAVDNDTLTITIDAPIATSSAALFDLEISSEPSTQSTVKTRVWWILLGTLVALMLVHMLTRKRTSKKMQRNSRPFRKW